MNFKDRLHERCNRLSARERKAVVLGMLLLILCGCLLSMLRGVDRLIEGSPAPGSRSSRSTHWTHGAY